MIGTTPTHIFRLPFGTDMIKKIHVIYRQGNTVLKKTTEDCVLSENTVEVSLTQEDTFLFDHRANVEMQVRVLTTNDEALKSNIIVRAVSDCLESEVLA